MNVKEEELLPDRVELQRCWLGNWDWARPTVTEEKKVLCCFLEYNMATLGMGGLL